MKHPNKRSHSPDGRDERGSNDRKGRGSDDRGGRGRAPDLDARKAAREKDKSTLWDSSRSRSPPPLKDKQDKMNVETTAVPKKKQKLVEKERDKGGPSDSESSVKVTKQKKNSGSKKKKSRSASPSSSSSSDSNSSDSESRKRKKSKGKKHKKKKSKGGKKKSKKSKKSKKASSSSEDSSESEQEEVPTIKETRLVAVAETAVVSVTPEPEAAPLGDMWEDATKHRPVESEELIGPKPKAKDSALDARNYGGALLPGEGEAIAGFVQAGKRIPRRGEVGVTSDEIEAFEGLGYVMSGSRHKRMNAIRIRKENQVYSAEEKRALSLLNFEERANKEKKLMADFHRYLLEKDSEK